MDLQGKVSAAHRVEEIKTDRKFRAKSRATIFGVERFVSRKKWAFGKSSLLRRSPARQSTKKAHLYFRLELSSILSVPKFEISFRRCRPCISQRAKSA